jgi:dihydrofolate reductase
MTWTAVSVRRRQRDGMLLRVSSPLLRLYIAASLDGFIATPDGGVGWLDDYNSPELGYDEFMKSIGTVVMGRATYEQAIGFGGPWPYAGKRTIVLTSRPIPSPPAGVERWPGDVASLADHLRSKSKKDVWICGGARTARAFLDLDQVDRIELYVIPVLLGDGLPLFERSVHQSSLRLDRTRSFENGVVEIVYDFKAGAGGRND